MEENKKVQRRRISSRFLRSKAAPTDHHKDLAGLKLLVTVVNREKAEFYIDFLHQFFVGKLAFTGLVILQSFYFVKGVYIVVIRVCRAVFLRLI